jgi:hypothetical protein
MYCWRSACICALIFSSLSKGVGKITAIGSLELSVDFREEARLELRTRAEVAEACLPRLEDMEQTEFLSNDKQLEFLLAVRFGPSESCLRDAAT